MIIYVFHATAQIPQANVVGWPMTTTACETGLTVDVVKKRNGRE